MTSQDTMMNDKRTTSDARIYGTAPISLGVVDLSPKEMMFWLYCPIKLINSDELVLPPNLMQFSPIVEACMEDAADIWRERYVYLTAKTLWCTPDNTAQRPGWHCDGFMTDDLNYVWCDQEPTLFCLPEQLVAFTQDHPVALKEMEFIGEQGPHMTYPLKTLLRLDDKVLHRVNDFSKAGIRSFVKLSISRNAFNLVGNAINHGLAPDWHYANRSAERNPEVARLNDIAEVQS